MKNFKIILVFFINFNFRLLTIFNALENHYYINLIFNKVPIYFIHQNVAIFYYTF